MRKIKKITCLMLVAIICMATVFQGAAMQSQAKENWPSGPSIDTPCAIVMEANTGTVLYEKNAQEQHYPASITKIMTTLLALENSDLSETVTFSKDSIYKTEGSGIARDVDEQLTMEQCLYAVMLESANECAYAVAEHVGGGDYSKFIQMMNDKAKELGCKNTNFVNCNGLPDTKHLTTSYDMALIAQAAIKNEMFRKIISTKTYTIPVTNKNKEKLVMFNHHAMLSSHRTNQYLYENVIGGKTGYTIAAQHTLVTYAEKNGMLLICVVMNTGTSEQYNDTKKLFEYCFNNYKVYNVADNETRYSADTSSGSTLAEAKPFVQLDANAEIVLPKKASFTDTTVDVSYESASESVVGSLVYSYAGKTVGQADVKTTGAVVDEYPFSSVKEAGTEESSVAALEAGEKPQTLDAETTKSSSKISAGTILKIVIGLAVAVVVVFILIRLGSDWMIRKRRKQRREKKNKEYPIIKNNKKWNPRG